MREPRVYSYWSLKQLVERGKGGANLFIIIITSYENNKWRSSCICFTLQKVWMKSNETPFHGLGVVLG